MRLQHSQLRPHYRDILTLRRRGKHLPEIAKELTRRMGYPVGVSAVRYAIGVAEAESTMQDAQPEMSPLPDPVEDERRKMERREDVRREMAELRSVAGEKSLRATLERLAKDTVPHLPPPTKYRPTARADHAITETLVMQWSDWHAYEIVDSERVRGFNQYDASVFGRRVRRVVDAAVAIKTLMEKGKGWRFPKLVIGANGDFVSGTIHEVERHSDAPSIVQAVYGCGLVMAEAIRDLSAHFEQVEVFCTAGNHGRLPDARRMQQKDPTRSWDTFIYYLARTATADCPNIQWFIPNSYSVTFDVEGWRFLQTHGHDVKSWNSIPHYGINRLVSNLNALEASRNRAINYLLLGHFHNATSLGHAAGEWFINGSLIGATEFGIQALGKADRPTQWLFGVHRDTGVSHRWPIIGEAEAGAPSYNVAPWKEAP